MRGRRPNRWRACRGSRPSTSRADTRAGRPASETCTRCLHREVAAESPSSSIPVPAHRSRSGRANVLPPAPLRIRPPAGMRAPRGNGRTGDRGCSPCASTLRGSPRWAHPSERRTGDRFRCPRPSLRAQRGGAGRGRCLLVPADTSADLASPAGGKGNRLGFGPWLDRDGITAYSRAASGAASGRCRRKIRPSTDWKIPEAGWLTSGVVTCGLLTSELLLRRVLTSVLLPRRALREMSVCACRPLRRPLAPRWSRDPSSATGPRSMTGALSAVAVAATAASGRPSARRPPRRRRREPDPETLFPASADTAWRRFAADPFRPFPLREKPTSRSMAFRLARSREVASMIAMPVLPARAVRPIR